MTVRHTFFLFIVGMIEIELRVSPSLGNIRFDDCPLCLFLFGKTNSYLILESVDSYRFFDDAMFASLFVLSSGTRREFWVCL